MSVESAPSLEILDQSPQGITVEMTFPGMRVNEIEENGMEFQSLTLPGGGHLAHMGLAELPTYSRFIAVPRGARISIKVTQADPLILEGYQVYPVQEPLPDFSVPDERDFLIDPDFYGKNEFFPVNTVEINSPKIIRGCEVRLLTFMPISFNPARCELKVYQRIHVEIQFQEGGAILDERYRSPYFKTLYENLILNYQTIEPLISKKSLARPEGDFSGCEYLIISAPGLISQAEELALWKNRSGLLTHAVTTDETGDTSSEIQDYIQDAYDTWNIPPSFVLFLGDAEYIPPTYYTRHPSSGRKVGTDLYYATVDGSDFFPDIYHGRISVDNSQQADEVVSKILNYQRDPIDHQDFYTNANIAAYFQDNNNNGYADRFFLQTSEVVRDFLISEGYTGTRIYCTNSSRPRYYYYGDPIPPDIVWDGDADKIIESVNSGGFILNHRDHGYKDSWSHPYFDIDHINSLSNDGKPPVVVSLNCQTGWFDNETDEAGEGTSSSAVFFCETFLRKCPGGAIGTFGHTRTSYSGYNDEICKGVYDGIWTNFDPSYPDESSTHPIYDPMYRMGVVLNFSRFWMYDKYYLTEGEGYPWTPSYDVTKISFEMFHYMGDPTMEIWTAIPGTMNVSHQDEIEVGATSMTVSVSEENALVCASMEGEILAVAEASGGSAELDFGPGIPNPGTMDIVVTKHDIRPYEGQVDVVYSSKPVTIVITPDDPPVIVPQGGSFGFTGYLTNNTEHVQTVDVWAMAKVPHYGMYGPLKRYDGISLSSFQSINRHLRQNVPDYAPPGDYLYVVYCGEYASSVIDSSYFEFEVIPGMSE
jgi:hypothetical protein